MNYLANLNSSDSSSTTRASRNSFVKRIFNVAYFGIDQIRQDTFILGFIQTLIMSIQLYHFSSLDLVFSILKTLNHSFIDLWILWKIRLYQCLDSDHWKFICSLSFDHRSGWRSTNRRNLLCGCFMHSCSLIFGLITAQNHWQRSCPYYWV